MAAKTFNLDTLEREGSPDPFTVVLGGHEYTLVDPKELDWQELVAAQRAASDGNPERSVQLVVAEGDREAFFANRLPAWKLDQLFRAYNEHFGLPTPGEAPASPSS